MNDGAANRYAVRRATLADHPAVESFTADTWGEGSDYVPRVYRDWIEAEHEAEADVDREGEADSEGAVGTQRTFVAVDRASSPPADAEAGAGADDRPDGRAVGLCQAVALSEHEGWVQAMRVDADHRGEGLSTALNDAAFRWLAEQGCVVGRNMVFSWNVAGLGGSRAAGFDPCTEFRWAYPEPGPRAPGDEPAAGDAPADSDAPADGEAPADSRIRADAAWSFWQGSDVRTHLRGLALDADESWAMSELTRERLRRAAEEGRLRTVGGNGEHDADRSPTGLRGFSLRNRTYDREADDGGTETWAEYAVAAWVDATACGSVLRAVARDAAAVGADRTRVLVPESARWVSDVAAARVEVSDEPDFVMAADLTRRPWDRG